MSSSEKDFSLNEARSASGTLIDQIITEHRPPVRPRSENSAIGVCIDAHHPVLGGRIRIRTEAGERWLPTLHGATFRRNDRVLIQHVSNSDEPIVIGVVDGFKKRPALPRESGPTLTLENDESVKVVAANGQRLLEVFQSDGGPVVKILNRDTRVRLPGRLSLSAASISLKAEQGGVSISATDDVEVRGEEIRLN